MYQLPELMMTKQSTGRHFLTLAALFFIPSTLFAQDFSLEATYGEIELESGFTPAPYVLELTAGGTINTLALGNGCVGMIAEAPDLQIDYAGGEHSLFISAAAPTDVALVVNTPDGEWLCDDDSAGDLNPFLELEPVAGVYDIWVGTVNTDAYAEATLFISEFELTDQKPASTGLFNAQFQGTLIEGRLGPDDMTRDNGAWMQEFPFTGKTGDFVIVDLRSDTLDTWLMVTTPSGESFNNDDFAGDVQRSLLALTLSESGEYRITASSFDVLEEGEFVVGIEIGALDKAGFKEAFEGELRNQDNTRSNGQFSDTYTFQGLSGQQVSLNLESPDFDTVLILESPSGLTEMNDDTDHEGHSLIQTTLTESGEYRVLATSYEASETGHYALNMTGSLDSITTGNSERTPLPLNPDEEISGSLSSSDVVRDEGEYQDVYVYQGKQGDRIRFIMSSEEIDTYLRLITPAGNLIENDDYAGSTERSLIELILPEDGLYTLQASSYESSETGAYRILARPSRATSSNGRGLAGSQVYGVFVGVSDYGRMREEDEGWNDLEYTASDALIAQNALLLRSGMAENNAIMLQDSEATVENLEQALAAMAERVGPDDTFVFFFSGHGEQVNRSDGPVSTDADGRDEALVLFDGMVTDDRLGELMDGINANTSLLILDSCYSGGFSKDLIVKPGRMGLFSSEEDVPSMVAEKFRAGGFLSHFFREAIEDGAADSNQDNFINAIELSEYLHKRYRDEDPGKEADEPDVTDSGFQHLITDRGGLTSDAILFTLY